MSLYAHISAGEVVNVAVCDDADFAAAQGWTGPIDGITPRPGIGWTTSDGGKTFSPRPAPGPTADQQAQTTFNQTLTGIDLSAIVDPAAKSALSTIIATLTGDGGSVHVHASPKGT